MNISSRRTNRRILKEGGFWKRHSGVGERGLLTQGRLEIERKISLKKKRNQKKKKRKPYIARVKYHNITYKYRFIYRKRYSVIDNNRIIWHIRVRTLSSISLSLYHLFAWGFVSDSDLTFYDIYVNAIRDFRFALVFHLFFFLFLFSFVLLAQELKQCHVIQLSRNAIQKIVEKVFCILSIL